MDMNDLSWLVNLVLLQGYMAYVIVLLCAAYVFSRINFE